MLLVQELSKCMGPSFEQIAELFVPAILKNCSRANNVFVSTASDTLKITILSAGIPGILPMLNDSLRHPNKTLRQCSIASILNILQINSPPRLESFVEVIESAVKEGVVDRDEKVRNFSKEVFEVYKQMFPDRFDG